MWEVMVLYTKRLIYIRLLNEGTLVYRPTQGEEIERSVFKVLPTGDYDPDDEQWEFPPGKIVRCTQEIKGDREVLIAVEEV
jgi:hypothetical protein